MFVRSLVCFSKILELFLVNLFTNMSHFMLTLRHAAARLQTEGQGLMLLETNKA